MESVTLVALLKGMAAMVVGVPLLVFFLQERLIFLPRPLSDAARQDIQLKHPKGQNVFAQAADGTRLHAWHLSGPRNAPLILYFGGNAEEVSWMLGAATPVASWRAAGEKHLRFRPEPRQRRRGAPCRRAQGRRGDPRHAFRQHGGGRKAPLSLLARQLAPQAPLRFALPSAEDHRFASVYCGNARWHHPAGACQASLRCLGRPEALGRPRRRGPQRRRRASRLLAEHQSILE